jgi:recombination protein RecA
MANADELLKKFTKEMGDGVVNKGVEVKDIARIPTGIFPLDLALRGGIPRGRITITYGNESSCKTGLSYLVMAQVQREGKRAVYVDLEHSLDPTWAIQYGLNMDELIVVNPQFAEQAVDIIEGFLYADDVGIVVVDSLAAMTTDNEIASSAEKMNVGGASYIIGKMVRKAVIALAAAAKKGNYPSLFCINQIRNKIGVLYGSSDTMPGGNSLRFASSLTIKLYGKDEIVKEVSPDIPTFKLITGSIQKAKMPIMAKAFEYSLTMLPHGNLKVGQAPTWNFVASYCKNAGAMTQAGQGKPWKLLGKEGSTQKELKAFYEIDQVYRQAIHDFIIQRETSKGVAEEVEEVVDTETGEIKSVVKPVVVVA